ncbi:MAG TPA: acetolactate synthase small subunit [Candidatus Hydrogenedentes bacterium]|nr:acetolactate synthase small subunit [Candidatus Hydrogenedentota bacterium]HOJ69088.1 acetolactate synthase small subunit [Candidatus Hydrogenedentota bacterium]HOK91095.1 acetolactate synthase small subunit [Candidatus Hydrogenedentota bacterium]HPO30951.1 acetolactate synthase small subunit [Candidatus Hydrogenedentota bacterium]
MSKKHTISVLVHNQFGVLARVSGMFSARGYNIISLCVGETEDPRFSRMTVTVRGDDNVLAQIIQQLNKLVDVIEVDDLTSSPFVERELVMVKVKAGSKKRDEVLEIAQIFRARVVDLDQHTMTVEVTGAGGKVTAFIEMMRPFGIRELVRTGVVAIRRSAADNHEDEEETA